jgi:hypothetical protein
MLESFFFHKEGCINKIININFDNYEITFQKFEGAKKKTLFDDLIGFWHSK